MNPLFNLNNFLNSLQEQFWLQQKSKNPAFVKIPLPTLPKINLVISYLMPILYATAKTGLSMM